MSRLESIAYISQLILITLPPVENENSFQKVIEWLSSSKIGNVLLRTSHFGNGEIEEKANRVQKIVHAINHCIGIKPFIAADQEGGRVQGMSVTKIPPPLKISESELEFFSKILAKESAEVGINLILGPVLDIPCEGNFIGDRAFANDRDLVIQRAKIWLTALKSQNLIVTGKHFPGHGSTLEDTHTHAATVFKDADSIKISDMAPFIELMPYLDAIMSAHVMYPSLDDENIATYSKTIMTEHLNDFEGLRVSDSLGMRAATPIQNDFEQAALAMSENAIKAINAGCDLIIIGRPHFQVEPLSLEEHMRFVDQVLEHIETGLIENKVSLERLNDAYKRVIDAKEKIALIDVNTILEYNFSLMQSQFLP